MTNRSQKSRQRTAICRFSFVIGHWSFGKSFSAVSAVVRKNVAPASRRHLSLDNSFWVNTTFAGWKPAIHFFSRPRRARRFHRGSAVVYATFTVILVFLPVLTMSGIQGRLFAPLGSAYVLAILAS